MSIKLGQLLIKAGRINNEQLEEALRNQVVHGGKLGTNLVELGYLKEHELALILGHKLGVPFISTEHIAAINPEVISLISAEIASKYKVVPLGLDKRRLSLAMADPSDFAAIDAISFLTGFIVRPVVCPELLIISLLDKFYGIKRKLRYSANTQNQQVSTPQSADDNTQQDEHEAPSDANAEHVEDCQFPMFENFEGFHQLQGDQFEEAYLGSAYRSSVSLDNIAQELTEARNRDSIANVILNFISIAFPIVALLIMRGTSIVGWKASVRGEQLPNFSSLSIPSDEPSMMNTVLTTKGFFLGPVPEVHANMEVIKALNSRRQDSSLVLPLKIQDRIVLFLYLEGHPEQLAARLPELQRLVAKASMAFEILILRNKILMT